MSPYQIGESLCNRQHRTCLRISEGSLRSVTYRCCDTLCSCIVKSHNATVRQRQLQFALTLLACYATRHRTVNLVGEPVLTSHSLKLQYLLQVLCQLRVECGLLSQSRSVVCYHLVFALYGLVFHDGLWRRAEHLVNREVERSYAVSLLEGKAMVTRCLTYGVHWGTLAIGNLLYVFYCSLVDEQSHALL